MATIIDALIITLGLDIEGYRQSTREADSEQERFQQNQNRRNRELSDNDKKAAEQSKKNHEQQQKHLKELQVSFDKVKNGALMMFGALAGGLGIASFANFSKNALDSAVNTAMLAKEMGMSTERLTAWGIAAQRAGGDADAMKQGLSKLASMGAQLRGGASATQVVGTDFLNFGGDPEKIRKNAESAFFEYQRVFKSRVEAAKASGLSENMAVSQAAQDFKKMGFDSGMLALFTKSAGEVNSLVAAQEKQAKASQLSAAEALKLKNRLDDFNLLIDRFKLRILDGLLPVLTQLATKLGTIKFPDRKEIHEFIDRTITDLKPFIELITKFATGVNAAAKEVGGWSKVLSALVVIRVGVWAGQLAMLTAGLLGFTTAANAAGAAGAVAMGGLTAVLGVVGAGAAGAALGTWAYNNSPKTAEFLQNTLGKGISRVKAAFGSKEDQEALAIDNMSTSKTNQNLKAKLYAAGKKYGFDADAVMANYNKSGIDPNILLAQAYQESKFNPNAKSGVGAMGFGQFMPGTAKQYGLSNPYDAVQNSAAQVRYMQDLVKKYGSYESALAAYNGGGGAADYLKRNPQFIANPDYSAPVNTWRHQSADYVKKIMSGARGEADNKISYSNYKGVPVLPKSAMLNNNSTANNSQVNNININIKSTDPKESAQEVKTVLNEKLTTNFASGMR